MSPRRVVVIGAGIGGLTAALALAARGVEVTVLEQAAGPGGKMREVEVAGARLDAGPTVLTMRWLLDEICADAGTSLDEHLVLSRAEVLARHAWDGDARLDLFAEIDRSADAIGGFAGAGEARGYRAFCRDAQRTYRVLERSFIRASRPRLTGLVAGADLAALRDLWRMRPFATLWQALGSYFRDPRLRQLFGRYATYCGSSPFAAPATLMLVAHVEREGVWLVEGGMHRIARAFEGIAERAGAAFRYGAEAHSVSLKAGRVVGVRLASGEQVEADAVIVNADSAAVAAGLLGPEIAPAVPALGPERRSLSAVTWALVARTEGFDLARHNVFFSSDYRAEFDDILQRSRLPRAPTVYVCAQDRDDRGTNERGEPERLLCLVNAPPRGDAGPFDPEEIARCERTTFHLLERCGLRATRAPGAAVTTTPTEFERLFPGTGGALYGMASHGWRASFQRPGCRTRIPGLYLAGGSVHPGPGVPMAALSGRTAAAALLADHASTSPSRRTATRGGTSTGAATTAGTGSP